MCSMTNLTLFWKGICANSQKSLSVSQIALITSILRPAHHLSTRATRVQPLSKKLVPELELSLRLAWAYVVSISQRHAPAQAPSPFATNKFWKAISENQDQALNHCGPFSGWWVQRSMYPNLLWAEFNWTPWPPHAWTCKPFPGKIPEPTLEVVTLRAGTLWNPPK